MNPHWETSLHTSFEYNEEKECEVIVRGDDYEEFLQHVGERLGFRVEESDRIYKLAERLLEEDL